MSFLSKKAKQLQVNDQQVENLGKVTSDKAVDIIKKLSGVDNNSKGTLVDNYIVMTNVSGGTGTSTLTSNVAYAAACQGLKVLVIDLNILCPIQHTFLGIKQSVTEKPDLVSYILGRNNIGDCIDSSHAYSVMYANNRTIADLINCNADASINTYNDMINKLRRLYDLILVDCPMILENTLCNNALYTCDSMYVVWDEGLSAIANTDRLRRNMSYCGIDSYTKMRIILNKRTHIHYNMYPFKKLNLELVEVLPFDTAVIENSLKAQIFCEKASSNSKNAAIFENSIRSLTNKILKIGGMVK